MTDGRADIIIANVVLNYVVPKEISLVVSLYLCKLCGLRAGAARPNLKCENCDRAEFTYLLYTALYYDNM